MGDTRRRALVAALVGAVGSVIGIAGVGHVYLREWRRAVAWFALVLGAGLALITTFADPQTATPSTLPVEVTAPLVVLFVLNTLDAYYVASRSVEPAEATAGDTCPSCGRETDASLEFCPWCAEPLEATETSTSEGSRPVSERP
jgi:hypothetical protein